MNILKPQRKLSQTNLSYSVHNASQEHKLEHLCLWTWWGFEFPSCISDIGILHKCYAASLSCFPIPAEDKFSALRKPNQYDTAVLEKGSLLYEMKTSLWRYQGLCVSICACVCVFAGPQHECFCLFSKQGTGTTYSLSWCQTAFVVLLINE